MSKTAILPNEGVIQQLKATSGALNAPALAKILGISAPTVYRMAQHGQIPSFKIGGSVRFDGVACAAWLSQVQ